MNYIKHALKDWADEKGFEIHFYADAGRDSSYYIDKNGASHPHPTLDLSWWREVPIQNVYNYIHELAKIVEVKSQLSETHYALNYAHVDQIANATIAQRCEAKFNAEAFNLI